MQKRCDDTKVVIRSRKSKKDRQYDGQKKKDKEKFDDTKEVIRSRKLKKDRQYDGKQRTKRQTMINGTLNRKLRIEQHVIS